ncbi:hypothetical protein GAO09_19395 [Rhizobiales bacterium RZME27]|uniref:Uncharacterized protein n=1 Tax=Endobacterium cereale TaxID=2663029 RepID=A0A6A8AA88_9HYPH|nr:hypothetical protein [Endobacterium cereale]MQY48203.1 hypothetical protein [Endobacterium cereale]
MLLAEQIRSQARRQGREPATLASFSGQATSQETVTASLRATNTDSNSYVDQRIASFGTSLSLLYEPKVAAGTAAQFYRGDKVWAAVSINDVTGLSSSLSGLSTTAAGKVAKSGDTMTGPLIQPAYAKASLPNVATFARSMVYVTDLTGGAEFCYSDGSNWRRMSDRSIAN